MHRFFLIGLLILPLSTINCQINCIDTTQISKSKIFDYCSFKQNSEPKPWGLLPVCGCDNKTYFSNTCAYYNGMTQWTEGGCACIDSSVIDTNSYHYFTSIREWKPVCGCDGKTYANEVIAYFKGGITRWTPGPCKCQDSFIIDSLVDTKNILDYQKEFVCGCDSTTYFDFFEMVFKAGVTSARLGQCICKFQNLIDTTIDCGNDMNPVCGCDSVTYLNPCIAEKYYGVSKYKFGQCKCIEQTLLDTVKDCHEVKFKPVCGCDSITYDNICFAQKKSGILNVKEGVCFCPDYRIKDSLISCQKVYQPVCGCDGHTYWNRCISEKIFGIPVVKDYDSQYLKNSVCSCVEVNFIDYQKECNEANIYLPVCGCDSITYPNACVAQFHHGLTYWEVGPCPYNKCVDTNILDSTKYCSNVYEPVCGCNGFTYQNECIAYYKNGITKWKGGVCDSMTFVKSTLANSIFVYPSPAFSELIIECTEFPLYSFFISNMQGQVLVNEIANQNKVLIDLSNFTAGLYFIRINIHDKFFNRKIILKR